ncbi:Asp-tRNA(Asn)/Glu-tRNA(Gln) amidotransferase subunit GatC [Candidatus Falkowbacteria bacterium]|nr:Asp-tRNA(Asn)/Glu-tRNA(Gln) amidotransferase subunit GatC [Candidatus Falkowbacteria bacterium]MBT7006909.1 Asp-tRNA(Asn)/Glu-tRNA(Gln) amidotransferase subunit GatC [Candidatus Falkowbacteria bacterium]
MINEEHIEHLAMLAKLDVTQKEKKKYAEQISAILEYFDELKELNTKGIKPLAHVIKLKNVMRKDEVREIFSKDQVLAEAPELEKRQVKVNAVFE